MVGGGPCSSVVSVAQERPRMARIFTTLFRLAGWSLYRKGWVDGCVCVWNVFWWVCVWCVCVCVCDVGVCVCVCVCVWCRCVCGVVCVNMVCMVCVMVYGVCVWCVYDVYIL